MGAVAEGKKAFPNQYPAFFDIFNHNFVLTMTVLVQSQVILFLYSIFISILAICSFKTGFHDIGYDFSILGKSLNL